jgi:uncharacterized RDD family membrane protein YckC
LPKKKIYLNTDSWKLRMTALPYCRRCGTELPQGAAFCPKCGAAVMTEARAAPAEAVAKAAPSPKPALWSERFVAWLIDIAILNLILVIIGVILFWSPFALLSAGGDWWWITVFNLRVSSVVFFLYWTFTEGAFGQSFGKMIMRLRVTRLDGKPASVGQAAVESVGKTFLLPLDFLLGWALWPRRRQRVFNYLSDTIVVRQ